MPAIRKRARAPVAEESEEEAAPTQRTQRRRSSEASDLEDATQADANTTSQQQMVKNLVRLALASEYSRTPIRRADISAKVLGTQPRQFRIVFDAAQLALRQTFGMELVELPVKVKNTVEQRRAAQKSQGGALKSTVSNAWILRSVLPNRFRAPSVLPPPKIPTQELESAYVGLYTIIVVTIMLSGGSLPEAKMERLLRRTNAEESTPVDKTDKLFAKMIKEGYIVKQTENVDGDVLTTYLVGARGKVEIGTQGAAALVRTVYGEQADEELERRLERTLKLQMIALNANSTQNGANGTGSTQRRGKGRPRAEQAEDGNEDD